MIRAPLHARRRLLVLLLLGAPGSALGCRATPASEDPPRAEADLAAAPAIPEASRTQKPVVPPAELPPEWPLPPTWRTASDLAFERALDGWLPPGTQHRLLAADLAALRAALDGADATSLRAAVLLARTNDPLADEALLARLEARAAPPPGASERDAADVVAAASFEGQASKDGSAANAPSRLAELAAGKQPHPDLCTRVECARSALALGRDDGIPFLLQVLRTGTKVGRVPGPNDSPADLAFAQRRAAEALAARAGTEPGFRPEASVDAREAEAARLEALLPRAGAKR